MQPSSCQTVAGLALAVLFSAPFLSAHGGMYRGPGGAPPGLPTTPGLSGPGGPNTGGGGLPTATPTSWQYWWEYNKDPYLRLKETVRATDGGGLVDDGTQTAPEGFAPTERDKLEVVLPGLRRLLEKSANKDVATACMVAMAKIGLPHPDFDVPTVFRQHLARGNQEVRETAALCLGIYGDAQAIDDLVAIAVDDNVGRKLVGRGTVDDRTRAFAVYALGLIGRRHDDTETKSRVHAILDALALDEDQKSREIGVAALQAYGNLRLDPNVGAQKRLVWKSVGSLRTLWTRKVSKTDQVVQAHVPTAIARLLGRGDTAEHREFKDAFAEVVRKPRDLQDSVVQSCVLALGELALPRETRPDDEHYSKQLETYAKKGKDELARFFCLIALAKIGGDANRATLLKAYARGKKGTDKPWAGLALGVLARAQLDAGGAVDETIGRELRSDLVSISSPEHRAATAVALGLSGYRDASRDMLKLLTKDTKLRNEIVTGYLCIGLAMLGADEALPAMHEILRKAVRRPVLLTQAATAIGVAGDKDAVATLEGMLRTGDANLAKLAGIASAFRFVGDRRVIDSLARLMFERDMTTLSRAFVGAALGGIADKDPLPWNVPYAVGTNYRARTETLTNGVSGILDIL